MKRSKNNFVSAALSFEDFEKMVTDTISASDLLLENQSQELAAKKKKPRLKRFINNENAGPRLIDGLKC